MQKFYFTFMTKQSILQKGYVKITANNEDIARQVMVESFGEKWGFVYSEPQFLDQIEKFGLHCISSVTVDEFGNIVKREV